MIDTDDLRTAVLIINNIVLYFSISRSRSYDLLELWTYIYYLHIFIHTILTHVYVIDKTNYFLE